MSSLGVVTISSSVSLLEVVFSMIALTDNFYASLLYSVVSKVCNYFLWSLKVWIILSKSKSFEACFAALECLF